MAGNTDSKLKDQEPVATTEVKTDEVFVYRVTKPFGSRKKGETLEPSRETRRKVREGGCLEKISKSALKKEQEELQKKMAQESKNKMQKDSLNKAGK